MVEKCVMCGVDGEKVRLFDAICGGRMECICERSSIIENVVSPMYISFSLFLTASLETKWV